MIKSLQNEVISQDTNVHLQVNEKFAKKYEERKRREEIQKLQEKYSDALSFRSKSNSKKFDSYSKHHFNNKNYNVNLEEAEDDYSEEDSESDEEEDDDGALVTPEVDAQILKTIAMIRKRDPVLYNKEVDFFSEEQMKKAKTEWQSKQHQMKQQSKPMFLKDYHRQNLLDGGADDDNDENDSGSNTLKKELTFVEEQAHMKQELKSILHGAVEEEDNEDYDETRNMNENNETERIEGGLFKIRKKNQEELQKEEHEYQTFLKKSVEKDLGDDGKAFWDALVSKKTADPSESFLLDYVLNRGWVERSKDRLPDYEQIIEIVDDEDHVEAMEEFERQHNFRYEEAGSHQIITHARDIPETVRRTESKRKEERERRNRRKEEEKMKKKEELKRLKNLKKQEIFEKLKKIQEISGMKIEQEGDGQEETQEKNTIKIMGLDEVDIEKVLEDDFDGDDYDAKMSKMFGDEYYNQKDPLKKPVFEEDIDISDLVEEEENNLKNTVKHNLKNKNQEIYEEQDQYHEEGYYRDENEYQYEVEECYGEEGDDCQQQTSTKIKNNQKQYKEQNKDKININEYLDEYYKLDYEDMIEDLPTRFKYVQVDKYDYGLDPVQILMADDGELNKYFALKKMAPFRKNEVVEKDMSKFKKSRKKRKREFIKNLEEQQQQGHDHHHHPNNNQYYNESNDYYGGKKNTKSKATANNKDNDNLSKKKSTLTQDRLLSYGMDNHTQSKKYKKHRY